VLINVENHFWILLSLRGELSRILFVDVVVFIIFIISILIHTLILHNYYKTSQVNQKITDTNKHKKGKTINQQIKTQTEQTNTTNTKRREKKKKKNTIKQKIQ
jgi:hypothetical protein